MSNTKDTPMDYKQFEGHTPVKVKTIHTDEHGLVVSMDDYDILERDYDSLKLELQKQKEINAELVKIKDLVEELIEVSHFRNQWEATTEAFESLIKKSNEI